MYKLDKTIILVMAGIILVFCSDCVFAQAPFGSNDRRTDRMNPQGMTRTDRISPPEMIMGEVIKIDNESIVILTENGGEKELAITSKTTLIKEIKVGREQIKKGDNLLVIGQVAREILLMRI